MGASLLALAKSIYYIFIWIVTNPLYAMSNRNKTDT